MIPDTQSAGDAVSSWSLQGLPALTPGLVVPFHKQTRGRDCPVGCDVGGFLSTALTVLTLLCAWGSAGMTCEVTQLVHLARGPHRAPATPFPGEEFPVQGRARSWPVTSRQSHSLEARKSLARPTGGRLARTGVCSGGCVCTSHTSHIHHAQTHTAHTHSQIPHTDTHIISHTCTFTCSSLRTLMHVHTLTHIIPVFSHTHAHCHPHAPRPGCPHTRPAQAARLHISRGCTSSPHPLPRVPLSRPRRPPAPAQVP